LLLVALTISIIPARTIRAEGSYQSSPLSHSPAITTPLQLLRLARSADIAAYHRSPYAQAKEGWGKLAQAAEQDPVWRTNLSPLPQPMRSPSAAVGQDGNIYVFGGAVWSGEDPPAKYLDTTYIYHPRNDTWTTGKSMPVTGYRRQAVSLPDGRIAVLGGGSHCTDHPNWGPLCHYGTVYNRVDVYTPRTNSWSSVAPMFTPRIGFSAILYHGRIFVIGGTDGNSLLNSVDVYDPTANRWGATTSFPHPVMNVAATLDATGNIAVIGGLDSADASASDTAMYLYDGHGWKSGLAVPHALHDAQVALGSDKLLYVIGGYDASTNTYLSTVEVYDNQAHSWASKAFLPEPVAAGVAITTPNGQIYVIGDSNGSDSVLFATYKPANGPSSPTPSPSPIDSGGALFDDEFNETALDTSRWSVVANADTISVEGGVLTMGGASAHHRIASIPTFAPISDGSVTARARIRFDGSYQKFGFNVNSPATPTGQDTTGPSSGFYFDTLDPTDLVHGGGGRVDHIHAIAWSVPAVGTPDNILDISIPVKWSTYHDFAVQWTPSSVIFSIDGREVARVDHAFAGRHPVSVWNDRAGTMITDWVRVTAESNSGPSPTPSPSPAPSPPLAITTPNIKVVVYIAPIDQSPCLSDLHSNAQITAGALREQHGNKVLADNALDSFCYILGDTSNDPAPADLTGSRWGDFRQSKEYRGYIWLGPMTVHCSGGRGTPDQADLNLELNPGWTKMQLGLGGASIRHYDPGEVYRPWIKSSYIAPHTIHDGSEVVVEAREAQRIATSERITSYKYIGFDAPFIFVDLSETVSCTTGSVRILVKRSLFPTMNLYVNDHLADTQQPKVGAGGDLARFFVGGGPWVTPIGTGHLASAGPSLLWYQSTGTSQPNR